MKLIVVDSILFLTGILPLFLIFLKKEAFDVKQPIIPFVWLTALASIYEITGTGVFKVNATYWFQFYSLLCFVTVYYFFFVLLDKKYKKAFSSFFVAFILTYGISFFFFNKNNAFISTAINEPLLTLFVLTFSFLWFKELFEKVNISNLWKNADFYFVSGLMIYHSGTFFFFLLSGFIFSSNIYFYDYWMVNIVATVVLRIFLIAGIWRMKQD